MNNEIIKTGSGADEVVQYDPERGLKSIAVAEAAENYYARAKDGTKLFEAIEAKLGAERDFIVWFDKIFHGGIVKPGGNRQVADLPLEGIPDKTTRKRWRKRLKDPTKFGAELAKAHDRCLKITEFQESYTKSLHSGENEWYTPAEYLAAACDVLGKIDLDPASSEDAQKRVGAGRYFTKEDNGLEQDWFGSVWLNPPYSQPHIAEFVSKLVSEWRRGHFDAGIMLTHNYTDTAWFHEAAGACDAICFTRGRIKFYDRNGVVAAPTQRQAFFYFGDDVAEFAARYCSIGFIVEPLTTGIDP